MLHRNVDEQTRNVAIQNLHGVNRFTRIAAISRIPGRVSTSPSMEKSLYSQIRLIRQFFEARACVDSIIHLYTPSHSRTSSNNNNASLASEVERYQTRFDLVLVSRGGKDALTSSTLELEHSFLVLEIIKGRIAVFRIIVVSPISTVARPGPLDLPTARLSERSFVA